MRVGYLGRMTFAIKASAAYLISAFAWTDESGAAMTDEPGNVIEFTP